MTDAVNPSPSGIFCRAAATEGRYRRFREGTHRAANARVVEDDVQPAELVERRLQHGLHVRLDGDVGANEDDGIAVTGRTRLLDCRNAVVCVVVGNDHLGALVQEP